MSIGLIDANNFYASVERAFDPALSGRPLVVVGNNDGIIVARSPEANNCDARIRRPPRLLRQKLGSALIWPTSRFIALIAFLL